MNTQPNDDITILATKIMKYGYYNYRNNESFEAYRDEAREAIQRLIVEARLSDFKRMETYYGRGNIKLWDEPDNNHNNVYLQDHINELQASLNNTQEVK